MEFKKERLEKPYAIKFSIHEEGKEIGRIFLFLISNQLHKEPYGFMEDLFVEEAYRGKGYGKKLVEMLIEEARKQGCYKLIGNSRYGRESVHKLYLKHGFKDHGKCFRKDLI